MMMEPGELHFNTRSRGSATFSVTLVDAKLVQAAAHELGSSVHLAVAQAADPRIFETFLAFQASLASRSDPLQLQTRLAECLAVVLGRCAEQLPRQRFTGLQPGVRRAQDYLLENYAETVTLSDLEAVTGLSRFHLLRSFAAAYGLPPHAYQTQVRIARAMALLRAGAPAATTATQVGFAHQSHLARPFQPPWGFT